MKNLIFMWSIAILCLIETGVLLFCYYHVTTILVFGIALMAVGIAISITIDWWRDNHD